MTLANISTVTAALPPRIVIHGQEGVGKTSLAARFPEPIFIRCEEDGCPSGLSIQAFPFCEAYDHVRNALSDLATEPHDFKTLVIDSLDPLEALIWNDVCATNGWHSIEQPGFGKGYVTADKWWQEVLAALDFLRRERGMITMLLAHSAIERIEDPRAASYTSYQLRLHKRARGLIQDAMDAIGFLAPDLNITTEEQGFNKKRNRADGGSTRWLHWETRPSFVAKSRYGLPAKMMVPADFSYEAIASYFPAADR